MSGTLHPVHIVMVDDDTVDAYTVGRAFGKMSTLSAFEHVESGRALFDQLSKQDVRKPDIILLDINMPRMNGFEVLSRLRDLGADGQIPVVMLTTSDNDDDVREAYRRGANAYLSKPRSLAEMSQLVEGFESFWLKLARVPRH